MPGWLAQKSQRSPSCPAYTSRSGHRPPAPGVPTANQVALYRPRPPARASGTDLYQAPVVPMSRTRLSKSTATFSTASSNTAAQRDAVPTTSRRPTP